MVRRRPFHFFSWGFARLPERPRSALIRRTRRSVRSSVLSTQPPNARAASKLGRVAEITQDRFPWPPGSATGIGSLPGTDPVEAMRLVFGELPDLPHLAELPARGAGADLTGRTAALLIDLPVELTPG